MASIICRPPVTTIAITILLLIVIAVIGSIRTDQTKTNDCASHHLAMHIFAIPTKMKSPIATIYGHSNHHYHRRWHHPRPPSSNATPNPRRPTSNLARPSVQHVISSFHPSPHDCNICTARPSQTYTRIPHVAIATAGITTSCHGHRGHWKW